MDLFDRYLHAVRCCLPKEQQDDIVRELSEDLQSQVEDREAELGRPLDRAEQEAILKKCGHPLLLAARYLPQRHLVGPVVFPIYWFVLRIALLGAFLAQVIAAAVFIANGKPFGDAMQALVPLPFTVGVIVFGWVTLVFAFLDRQLHRLPFLTSWNPATLPPVRPARAPSTVQRVGELLITAACVVYWAAVPNNQWLVFGPAWMLVRLGPIWQAVHIPILVLASAAVVLQWMKLAHPESSTFRSVAHIAMNLAALVVLGVLMSAGNLVVAVPSADARLADVAQLANIVATVALVIAAIQVVIETVREMARLMIRSRGRGVAEPQRL
jgi:hypothetical protein